MTDDTKGKEKTTSPTSNSILAFDAFGEKKTTGQVSLGSIQTASSSLTTDRGVAFGLFKGGGSALSHLVTDPIAMASQPMTTLQGLGNVSGMASEMYGSARTALTSGNGERLGTFLGSSFVNAALIGTAIRGGHGTAQGMGEANGFKQATAFESRVGTQVAAESTARNVMLNSAETATPAAKLFTQETLAETALRGRTTGVMGTGEVGLVTAGENTGSLVNEVLNGSGKTAGTIGRELHTPGVKPTGVTGELPNLDMGAVGGREVHLGQPPHGQGVVNLGGEGAVVKLGEGPKGGIIGETRPGVIGETRPGVIGETRPGVVGETNPGVVVNEGKVVHGGGTPAEALLKSEHPPVLGEGRPVILNEGKVVVVEGNGGNAVLGADSRLGTGAVKIGEPGAGATSFTRIVDDGAIAGGRSFEPPKMGEFKSPAGAKIEGFQLEGVKVEGGKVVVDGGRTVLGDSRVLADGKVMTEGRVIGQVDEAGRVIVTREIGGMRLGEPGSGFRLVEEPAVVKPEITSPRTTSFVAEERFTTGRVEVTRGLEEIKGRGVEPVKVESFSRTLDEYARNPSTETFNALKQEWRQLETSAKSAGVADTTIRELQTTVEKAVGTEATAGGARITGAVVEQPVAQTGWLSEKPATNVVTEPRVVLENRAFVGEQRPVVLETKTGPVIETTKAPVEQPTWKATEQRIATQLEDVRTTVREAGGNTQVVNKLDEAVAKYAKEPTATNLQELNKAFREVESGSGASTMRGGRLSEQLSEVRQNVIQHMPPEHAAITRIEAAAVRTEAGAVSTTTTKITENISQSAEKMRNAGSVEDFVKESRQLERNVTKYLTEEVRAGRMTPEQALDVQRATRTLQAEAQATTTAALREQGSVLKFKTEPEVKAPAEQPKVVNERPAAGGEKAPGAGEKAPVREGEPVRGGEQPPKLNEQPPKSGEVVPPKNEVAAVRKQIADEALGPKAPEYQKKIDAVNDAYTRITNATDDVSRARATTEFRQSAAEVNTMLKESGVPKPVAEALSVDVRGSLQQARIARVATELQTVTAQNAEFVSAAQKAIREATIPEPVRTQLRAQVHTFESHVNGLTSTETQWGTNAGNKALAKQLGEMEKSFQAANIDFRPFSERAASIQQGLETYRAARQSSWIGDNFFSPAREFALTHPLVGKPVDFLWNNPTMLKVYVGIGGLEIAKGFVSAAEYGRAADEKDGNKKSSDTAASGNATQAAVQYVAREAQPAARVSSDNAGVATVVAKEKPVVVEKAATEPPVKATAVDAKATTTTTTDAIRPTTTLAGQNAQNVEANRQAVAAQVSQDHFVAQRVSDKGDKVTTGGDVVVARNVGSGAFFSVPMTAQEIRNENRRKYGGLDVGYTYYAKGPGAPAVVDESMPIPMAQTNNFFTTTRVDIPERERPTNTRFDWKRTRLDPSALSRPDGFYMSQPSLADGRGAMGRGTAGASKRDENGSGVGMFAKKYAFLAQSAEHAKSAGNINIAPGTENSEALNPDNIAMSGGSAPQSNAPQTTYVDPNNQDDEPVVLT